MSATKVKILKGHYLHHVITDKVFPLVRPFKASHVPGESYVTVLAMQADGLINEPNLPQKKIRVKVADANAFEYQDDAGNAATPVSALASTGKNEPEVPAVIANYINTETESEAWQRILDTFAKLEKMTDALAHGVIKGLIISGPPGVGKSFTVEEILEKVNFGRTIAQDQEKYRLMKGGCSAIGLYKALYMSRDKGEVLVFDDCDSVLFDEDCLNLLKAALDTGHRRLICWNTESRVLRAEEIPNSFVFSGSIVFLTNVDFTASKSGRIANHLRAMMSRCHYMNLEMDCKRDQIIRIRQVMEKDMLAEFDFSAAQCKEILNYVVDNQDFLLELSLRMVRKIAELYKAEPADWKELVEASCLGREAKFDRLTKERDDKRAKEAAEMAKTLKSLDARKKAIKGGHRNGKS